MRFTTLDEWLAWLEINHPTEIDLGLDRVQKVAERLDILKPAKHNIMVAGTNGKGSCVTTLSTLLVAHDRKVGTYTSPHLHYFSERICINLVPVSDAELCTAFAAIDNARGDISLTYFEFATLAALDIFKRLKVDVCVLEVGLGGRLDAVNIVDADVAIVTSIGIDHEAWLGSDREVIGAEKAGIFRKNKHAICAEPNPPESIFSVAQKLDADYRQVNVDFSFGIVNDNTPQASWWWVLGTPQEAAGRITGLPLVSLPLQSVAAALYALYCLGLTLDVGELQKTLPTLALPGRMQSVFYKNRHFLLDVAHNPQATVYLAKSLQAKLVPDTRIFGVVAMMQDKDRQASLAPLVNSIDLWCPVELTSTPRAASITELTQDITRLGRAVSFSGPMNESIDWCLAQSEPSDLILICGSFFTVAEALAVIDQKSV